MDHDSLVALITERVVEVLAQSAVGGAPSAPTQEVRTQAPVSPGRRVLLCGAPGAAAESPAWQALRSVAGVRWVGVDWPGYPVDRITQGLGRCPDEVVPPPEVWDDLVRSVEAVVLPFAPLDVLARTALLLVDSPPAAAVVAGLIQGVPVLAGGDDAERLTRHSSRIPGGILGVVQGHVRTIQGMGLRLEPPAQIATHLAQGVSRLAGSASGGRDVVTNEDVLAAAQAGLSVLEVASGSIVTALARETANRNGIEVRFR